MILVIAEHNNAELSIATQHILTAAAQLNEEIHLLVVGFNLENIIKQAQLLDHIKLVVSADAPEYQHQLAENVAGLICTLAENYNYILGPATTFGKDLMPRVAALLDIEQISDITGIISKNTFIRPIYAGNAFATVQNDINKMIITVRPTAFAACNVGSQSCAHKALDTIVPAINTQFIRRIVTEHGTLPELSNAKIIVAGGRGFKDKQNFILLEDLAHILHAAIGASRAAVDAGFVANDLQIGQTGKVVAPDLYIAIGISGAIQHIAGIKDSKIIVAINSDPDAPIFKIADYWLVGDLFEVLPQLTASLSKVERFKSSE